MSTSAHNAQDVVVEHVGVKHVVLYAKPGCHLCDVARDILEDLAAEPERYGAFVLDEQDIRREPALFERYRWRIPVVTVAGHEVAEGQLGDEDVQAVIAALAAE